MALVDVVEVGASDTERIREQVSAVVARGNPSVPLRRDEGAAIYISLFHHLYS